MVARSGRLDRLHTMRLTFIGGVPEMVVSDNLKSGVTKPSRLRTGVNRSYRELATHYGFAVLPTRIKKRATRRAFHTAPHSDYCAVIRSNRAGCGRRPPWPLMIFRLGGMSQSPRRRRSE